LIVAAASLKSEVTMPQNHMQIRSQVRLTLARSVRILTVRVLRAF
jgi:hypothetical protein